MKPTVVFLTGATGFLGMEVLARLLEAGDRKVVALVRAADDAAAEDRLYGVLNTLWRDLTPYQENVRAVAGDVTIRASGSTRRRAPRWPKRSAVLHCAASISFDLPVEDARAINVEGTREVIGFARECKALGRLERFAHVSTAYVAASTRARSASASSTRGRSSATRTSRPSGRPSTWCARRPTCRPRSRGRAS